MELRRESVFAGETEGARRATGVSPAGAAGVPDPAVEAKAKRRRFTAEYKLRILREVDRAKEPGEVGAILRREGLYSSLVSVWRRDRDRVAKAGLTARKRGPKAKAKDPKVKQLEREIAKLRRRNERVELMLSIQKEASELLGIPLNPHDPDEND
jgi:transposase-like protein